MYERQRVLYGIAKSSHMNSTKLPEVLQEEVYDLYGDTLSLPDTYTNKKTKVNPFKSGNTEVFSIDLLQGNPFTANSLYSIL